MFELKPPHNPRSAVNTTHKYVLSLPVPTKSLGALFVSFIDLVKFRIAAIDNNNPLKKEFIHFRAYIDSFSDSYNATWNPQKYMGRGETFYKYDTNLIQI